MAQFPSGASNDVYDECFADDFLSYRWNGPALDKKAYKQMLLGFRDSFPGVQRTIRDVIVTEDQAALYYTWTGTDNYTFLGRTPTGKPLTCNEMYFIRFKNGKISEYRQYGDAYALGIQLGALLIPFYVPSDRIELTSRDPILNAPTAGATVEAQVPIVAALTPEESKAKAQARLNADTKRVGFVRGELFQKADRSWAISWGGKYPL